MTDALKTRAPHTRSVRGLHYRFGTASLLVAIAFGALWIGRGEAPLDGALPKADTPPVGASANAPVPEPADVAQERLRFALRAAPPVAPEPGFADSHAPTVEPEPVEVPAAHSGDAVEGLALALALLAVQNSDDPQTITDWLDTGVAVLELHTRHGVFLAIGGAGPGGFAGLDVMRATALRADPRSDMRMANLPERVLPMGMLCGRLGATFGFYDIDRAEVVFTQRQIVAAQNGLLQSHAGLAADDLEMAICFKAGQVRVAHARNRTDGTSLVEPGACNAG